MESVYPSSPFNVYIIDSISKIKPSHIVIEKIGNTTHVQAISTLEKPILIFSRKKYPGPGELSDILKYYKGVGKDEEGSQKIVKIIQKLLLKYENSLKNSEPNNLVTLDDELKQIHSQICIKDNIATIDGQIFFGDAIEKNAILINLLRKSILDFTILKYIIHSQDMFSFFNMRCEKLGIKENLTFIVNCIDYFETPSKKNAGRIVHDNINPFSNYAINISGSERVYVEMYKLLEDYEGNKETISGNIESYLKEILKLLSQNFSTCL